MDRPIEPKPSLLKRSARVGLGWLLVVVGIAALVLPGPGLLTLFAGLVLLAGEYEWARRWAEPAKKAALTAAADGVRTWPRILISLLGVAVLVGLGVVWGVRPDVPAWWPIAERWWLAGGWGTGVTLAASGLLALALVIYSFRRFRLGGSRRLT